MEKLVNPMDGLRVECVVVVGNTVGTITEHCIYFLRSELIGGGFLASLKHEP